MIIFIAAPSNVTRLMRKTLSIYPKALCNDGTPGSYYYSEDAMTNPNLMIFLPGGGACQAPQICKLRCETAPHLCTASTATHYDVSDTIWSKDAEENPPFHNFAKIYVHYCSSDVYTGTKNASDDINGYYFHGKYIIDAVVEDILANKQGVEKMNQLVFMGASAGAFGVTPNCDFVAGHFQVANKNLDVLFFVALTY